MTCEIKRENVFPCSSCNNGDIKNILGSLRRWSYKAYQEERESCGQRQGVKSHFKQRMSRNIGGGSSLNARHFIQSLDMYKIISRLYPYTQSTLVKLCIEFFFMLSISTSSIKKCASLFIFNPLFVTVAIVNNPYPHTFVFDTYSCFK